MNDQARQALCDIVARYGWGVSDDPRRLRALLADLCPGMNKEASVLVSAAEQGVPQEVTDSSRKLPWQAVVNRGTRRLVDETALTEEAARWAVETWALAGGVPLGDRATQGDLSSAASVTQPITGGASDAGRASHTAGNKRNGTRKHQAVGLLLLVAVIGSGIGLIAWTVLQHNDGTKETTVAPGRSGTDSGPQSGVPPVLVTTQEGTHPSPLDCTGEKGVSAADVRKAQEAWAKYLGRKVEEEDEIAPGVKMQFVLIPPGKFLMGSSQADKDIIRKTEGEGGLKFAEGETLHEVELTHPFYLAVYDVTKGQFAALVQDAGYQTDAEKAGDKDTWRSPSFPEKYDQTDNDPAVQVSWNDAVRFCEWLSKKKSRTYELPTEAQWEYACRAGTTTAYPFGDDPKDLGDYAWYVVNSGSHTYPVGGKKPNPWGLYDMHGNVEQWCSGGYEDYPKGRVVDPSGRPSDSPRVFRGGSWCSWPGDCRAAHRGGSGEPGYHFYEVGFRLALVPSGLVK